MGLSKSNKAGDFCACGAVLEAQCNVCAVGICSQCNAVAMQSEAPDVALATIGFGYVGDGYSARLVVARRVRSETYFGCRLPLAKLLQVIAVANQRTIHHLCVSCLCNAVPEAAEWTASGRVCQVPECVTNTTHECRRCRATRCEYHAVSGTGFSRISIALRWEPSEQGALPAHVEVPAPRGLCTICTHETELMLCNVCSGDYPDLSVGGRHFAVPVRHRGSERRRRQERSKSLTIAETYAAEWGKRWEEISSMAPPDRSRAFSEGRCYFTVDKGYLLLPETGVTIGEVTGVHAILDERDSQPPVACRSAVA
jgi:hypothetical protein